MLWAWQRFDKQAPALAACDAKRLEAESAPLSLHARAEPWMVTAMDADSQSNKAYAVTIPIAAFTVCLERDTARKVDDYVPRSNARVGRHQYEVLMPDEMLVLFYDGEFDMLLNPGLDGDACVRILHRFMALAYAEIPNRPCEALTEDAIVVETSHRPGLKMSYHGKIRAAWGVAATMSDQRLFWGRVATLITLAAASGDAEAVSLTVNAHKKEKGAYIVVQQLFCDMHVYTTFRLMRFLGACKWPKANTTPSHLVPRGSTREAITYDIWRRSLVSVRLRPAEDPVPPTLDMPAAWKTHVPKYWKTPIASARPASKAAPAAQSPEKNALDTSALTLYRNTYWPIDSIIKLSVIGGGTELANRELVFEDARGTFLRHVTYRDENELRQLLTKKKVAAIHIGSAGTHEAVPGTELRRYSMRELVFDLDASDYDKGACNSVRTCACHGKKAVCYSCWLYLELAAAVMHHTLTKRMGIDDERILWVWSGGRGMHIWVNHLSVLTLTLAERESLTMRFFDPPSFSLPLAPEIERIFAQVIMPLFETRALERPDFLTTARVSQWISWLQENDDTVSESGSRSSVPTPSSAVTGSTPLCDEPFAAALRAVLKHLTDDLYAVPPTPTELWPFVKQAYEHAHSKPNAPRVHSLYWLIAQYAWPRLDAQVTFGKRKTLRSPLSLNTRARKVALPMVAPCDPQHSEAYWKEITSVGLAPDMQAFKPIIDTACGALDTWLLYYYNDSGQ